MARKENVKKLSKFVYSTKMGRATCFEKGVEWADRHPRNGLVDVDGACAWLRDELPVYGEISTTNLDTFLYAFKHFCEMKSQQL